jgi:hypothetical protein
MNRELDGSRPQSDAAGPLHYVIPTTPAGLLPGGLIRVEFGTCVQRNASLRFERMLRKENRANLSVIHKDK